MMNHLRVTNHITLVAEAPGGVTARVRQRSAVGAPSRTAPRRARVYVKGGGDRLLTSGELLCRM